MWQWVKLRKHGVITLPRSLMQVNAETLYCQELSSFTGKQLDEFTLKKPANWKPDTAGRASTAATLVPTHVLSNIEANGFIGQPYSALLLSSMAFHPYVLVSQIVSIVGRQVWA